MIRRSVFISLVFLLFLASTAEARARVISLSPTSTEIIARIQKHSQLVAVTNLCDYPEHVKSLPKIDGMSPQYEKILIMEPDYIVGVGNGPQVEKKLKNLRLKTMVLPFPNSVSELKSQILKIGTFIEEEDGARQLISEMNKELRNLHRSRSQSKPKALVILWLSPTTVIGGQSFVSELMTLGGLENVMKDNPMTHTRLSRESLFEKNPELVILANPALLKTAESDLILRDKRLVSHILPHLFLRPGPRIIEGIKAFRELTL
ncbi:MAG: ABC-type Fe3+-hydroxamate transport system substrate-binding protein [Candidatus Marinamargulisbacteria bacterium]|jgi:ABC-type Fe3+-hydroxamate transport system substrate-binding protein